MENALYISYITLCWCATGASRLDNLTSFFSCISGQHRGGGCGELLKARTVPVTIGSLRSSTADFRYAAIAAWRFGRGGQNDAAIS